MNTSSVYSINLLLALEIESCTQWGFIPAIDDQIKSRPLLQALLDLRLETNSENNSRILQEYCGIYLA